MNMKTSLLLVATAAFLATAVPAQSKTTRHEFMDLEAAKRDIRKLEHDRAMAKRNHDWKKVAQDDRLIAQDRFWIKQNEIKLAHRHHGH